MAVAGRRFRRRPSVRRRGIFVYHHLNESSVLFFCQAPVEHEPIGQSIYYIPTPLSHAPSLARLTLPPSVALLALPTTAHLGRRRQQLCLPHGHCTVCSRPPDCISCPDYISPPLLSLLRPSPPHRVPTPLSFRRDNIHHAPPCLSYRPSTTSRTSQTASILSTSSVQTTSRLPHPLQPLPPDPLLHPTNPKQVPAPHPSRRATQPQSINVPYILLPQSLPAPLPSTPVLPPYPPLQILQRASR